VQTAQRQSIVLTSTKLLRASKAPEVLLTLLASTKKPRKTYSDNQDGKHISETK